MKCYLDDKTIYIFPSFLKCIGEGEEGKVYEYKKQALKIYHDPIYSDSMDSEVCLILQKLDTERIMLPRRMLLDRDGEFKGYTTQLIFDDKDIYEIKKEKLISELKKLENEIYYLANNHIKINDWHSDNFKYDGIMRFIDPGAYRYDKSSKENIRKSNYSILKEFIFYQLIKEKLKIVLEKYMDLVNEKYNDCSMRNNICDFFEKEMNPEETLNHYIKRIAKPH